MYGGDRNNIGMRNLRPKIQYIFNVVHSLVFMTCEKK